MRRAVALPPLLEMRAAGAWGSQPLVSTRLRRRAGVRTASADSQRVEARAYVLEVLADVRTIDRSLRVQEPPEAI